MNYWSISIILASIVFSSYITHRIDERNYSKEIIEQQEINIDRQKELVKEQSNISKKSQDERDAIKNRYDDIVSKYNGMRKQFDSTVPNERATVAIPKEGVKLYGQDAIFLTAFARDCEISELERNEVIEKYESLIS